MIARVKLEDYDVICDNPIPGVFALDKLFTKKYCKELIDAAEKHGKWTTARHAEYPTHDIPLEEVSQGLSAEYMLYQLDNLVPYFASKYHLNIEDGQDLSFDTFIAKYSEGEQNMLGMHHDDSYLTTLVTLNDDYEGGGTYFQDFNTLLKGAAGTVTIHPGELTHFHGARPTTKGTRYVLVSFIKPINEV